ncbi:beta-lactamase class A [Neobacillus niacini]|uniref:serine hydrolase n=1 Tax=Neobacillus driksii TaxID=3035913 RepID=UPI0027859E0B|nr:serine hydrolase [Neobacillus niacini]MDQ0971978.1 beta-lactamase class A [Neobacillus niacini]
MEILKKKIQEELNTFHGRVGLAIELADTKPIYMNSQEVFQSASLIKIPILLSILLAHHKGKIDIKQQVTISNENKVGGSGVLQALSNGLSISVKDLMTLMIIVSDNTATNILIDLLGIEGINATIQEMGLEQTKLNRKMMDFAAINQGKDNQTTAEEMLHCLKLVNECNKFFGIDGLIIAKDTLKLQQFRDKLPALVDEDKITVFNKTGELSNVEHDCAIFECQGRIGYVTVLMDRLHDQENAKRTIRKIGKHISDFFIRT